MATTFALLLAVPPPVEQATADCERPVFATDQLVCGDPELRERDSALGTALLKFVVTDGQWLEAQGLWLKRRSRCAFERDHRGCVSAAYTERHLVVRPWLETAVQERATCSDGSIDAVVLEQDRVGFFSQDTLVGVATLTSGGAGWSPYLTASRSRTRIEAAGAAAGRLRCKLAHNRKNIAGGRAL